MGASVVSSINRTVPVPGVAQTIVVCRLRTVLELGRPRKTMACPTANLLYSYFLDTALTAPVIHNLARAGLQHGRFLIAPVQQIRQLIALPRRAVGAHPCHHPRTVRRLGANPSLQLGP